MTERVLVPDYARRKREQPIALVIIHATRGDAPMDAQYGATVNWFKQAPDQGGWTSAADVVIGARGEVAECYSKRDGDWRVSHAAFSAGFGQRGYPQQWAADEVALSVEIAQPARVEPFTEESIRAAADFLRPILAEYRIPLVHIEGWDQARVSAPPRGFIGHDETDNGRKYGKSDPGHMFPWGQLFEWIAAGERDGRDIRDGQDVGLNRLDNEVAGRAIRDARSAIATATRALDDAEAALVASHKRNGGDGDLIRGQ